MKRLISTIILFTLILTLCACTDNRETIHNTNENIGAITLQGVESKTNEPSFTENQVRLALRLLRETAKKRDGKNLLLSPLSVQLALTMTANGAEGDTLSQMEELLGGNLSLSELNQSMKNLSVRLASDNHSKINLANSIWLRDNEESLSVKETFLQTNQTFFQAEIQKRPFNEDTLKEINRWAEEKTDGMIDEILDRIDSQSVMYLINAVLFEGEWESPYHEKSVNNGSFTDINGNRKTVEMMHSDEFFYLEDGKATGFMKPYKGGSYLFAALLPNEDTDIYEYIDALTEDGLLNTLKNPKNTLVYASLPKFSYENSHNLSDSLKALGITKAFDPMAADFSALGQSAMGNLFIGDVIHKTHISVDTMGTKAGAVTAVGIRNMGMPMNPKTVTLNRPFIYMIVEADTMIPLFVGVAADLGK